MFYSLFCLFFSFFLQAQEELQVVAVGEAEIVKETILFSFKGESKSLNDFSSILKNDFSFYQKNFNLKLAEQNLQADYLISLFLKEEKLGGETPKSYLVYDISLERLKDQQKIYSSHREILEISSLRKMAHEESHAIYEKITGKKSIFNSKMAFVSDRTSKGHDIRKELYIMDFDGQNKRRLTYHKGIVISPAISHDGKQILYSLIPAKNRKNISLRMIDLETSNDTLISSRPGINSGAVFSNKANHIYLTLSYNGNAEIYEMNLLTKESRSITKHPSPDVDPSLDKDGKILAFLSGRPGDPMIYTLDPQGVEKSVKRISFVGRFNATPRFSPDGNEIVFSSWLDNRFDIFRIGANGRGLVRLTKNFGSNEDPTYSNDGQFLAFSSQKVISREKAEQKIYIMDREGEIWGTITPNFGNCITPRWTK